MSKIRLTEEKLQSIIEESVMEVLTEAMEDEGIGSWLGNKLGSAVQWGRNQLSDFGKGFRQGRQNLGWTPRQQQEDPNMQPEVDPNAQPAADPNPQAEQPAAPEQPAPQQPQQPVQQQPRQRVSAGQQTAQALMRNIRSGKPFMMTQAYKAFMTNAVKAYQQQYPTAVNTKVFTTIRNLVANTKIGQQFTLDQRYVRPMQTLFNATAKARNWSLEESVVRAIIAESLRKVLNEGMIKESSMPARLEGLFKNRIQQATHFGTNGVKRAVEEFYNKYASMLGGMSMSDLMDKADRIEHDEICGTHGDPSAAFGPTTGHLPDEDAFRKTYDDRMMKESKTKKNNGKVKLNEAQLEQIVMGSVKRVLNEGFFENLFGKRR